MRLFKPANNQCRRYYRSQQSCLYGDRLTTLLFPTVKPCLCVQTTTTRGLLCCSWCCLKLKSSVGKREQHGPLWVLLLEKTPDYELEVARKDLKAVCHYEVQQILRESRIRQRCLHPLASHTKHSPKEDCHDEARCYCRPCLVSYPSVGGYTQQYRLLV